MEFPKNIAEQLDGDSVGAVRAWRHQMICKLIDAGVTNPGEIKSSVDVLYKLVVSPPKNNDADSNQIKCGVIPAGTEIRFGYYYATTLEHDLEVNAPQEVINRKIIEKVAYDRGEKHLLVSSDIKKELESRNLSQQERKILNQAFVYEPNPEIIENFKIKLESPDLQQETRDALSHVVECLTDTQTLASLWLEELRGWLQSHPTKDQI